MTSWLFFLYIAICKLMISRAITIEFYDRDGNYTDAGFIFHSESNDDLQRRASDRPGQATSTHSCGSVRSVPSELRRSSVMKPHGISTFYQKYTEAYGIPVFASQNVPDDALKRACYLTRFMFADNYAVRNSFYHRSGRTAVIGAHEGTTSIPEHSNLDPVIWNKRARGLGATDAAPVSTGGEENLLCYTNDRYHKEDIYLHEFSHGVANLGAKYAISGFFQRLDSLYNSAKSRGLWANTYAMSTRDEYFAEGVQSYFNVNDYANPSNGIHGPINTKDKLQSYDSGLFNLIEEVWPCHNVYIKRCQSSRALEQAQNLRTNCVGSSGGGDGGGSCNDNNPSCRSWASRGECTRNPAYMLASCKRSCGVCGTSASCTDQNKYCQGWAQNGECDRNPGYMNTSCKKSCHRC